MPSPANAFRKFNTIGHRFEKGNTYYLEHGFQKGNQTQKINWIESRKRRLGFIDGK